MRHSFGRLDERYVGQPWRAGVLLDDDGVLTVQVRFPLMEQGAVRGMAVSQVGRAGRAANGIGEAAVGDLLRELDDAGIYRARGSFDLVDGEPRIALSRPNGSVYVDLIYKAYMDQDSELPTDMAVKEVFNRIAKSRGWVVVPVGEE